MRAEITEDKSQRALQAELRRELGEDRVFSSQEQLLVHGYDGTWLDQTPTVVVSPLRSVDIEKTLRLASRLGVPVVPRGAGSGLAGGSVPNIGQSIVLSLNRLDRIIEVDPMARVATVEAGVINAHLQAECEKRGLFYPPDPASLKQSTIGGNVATAASGPRCLKYGGTREYVLGMTVYLAGGESLQLGGRTLGVGADAGLMNLFIGSEGTLGVIGEVTVRLIDRPSARGTILGVFSKLDDASLAVNAALGAGILPLALEMMDQTTLRCVESHLHLGLPIDSEAILLVDVDGTPAEVVAQSEAVAAAFQAHYASEVKVATDERAAEDLWRARRSTSSSFGRLRPNKLGEDISAPRSEIPAIVRAISGIARKYDLIIPLFGHIGDGNLHPNILCDLRNHEEMTRVALAAQEIFAVALSARGTLSGEHGIGLLKRGFVPTALAPAAIDQMRRQKGALDPNGILNPGKIFTG